MESEELLKDLKQQVLENAIKKYQKQNIEHHVIRSREDNTIVDVIVKNRSVINEILKEIEIWHGEVISGNYKRPMPTNCLDNKKYCAKEYGALMIISNLNIATGERYLYKNKFNTEELAKDLKISRTTLERNIKKLEKLDCNILNIKNIKNKGIVYELIYGAKNEETNKINKYVTINQKMLKELICSLSNDAIKIYCLIKTVANEKNFTVITEKWICKNIGLNENSEKNKSKVRTIIKTLEKCKYIETKKDNIFYWDEERKIKVPQIVKLFRVCTFEEWKELDKKVE